MDAEFHNDQFLLKALGKKKSANQELLMKKYPTKSSRQKKSANQELIKKYPFSNLNWAHLYYIVQCYSVSFRKKINNKNS